MREHDVTSWDGTKIRTWQVGGDGPAVLLCPGVGSGPESWPSLADRHGLVSWYMRGTMGSDRPADERNITLDDHVADALAVLDDAGIERCVVMGWSMGVTIAAELALRYPDRVAGLLLVAGAPGDSFGGMLPLVPSRWRRTVGLTATRLLQQAGPLLDGVLHRMPVTDLTTFLLRHSGVIKPSSDPKAVARAVSRFLRHDWRWYFTLALALGEAPRQDLRPIVCPVTLLAGRDDVLATTESMATPAGALPQARLRVLPCSHYLPLEAPEVVSEELDLVLDRVAAVDFAVETTTAFTSGSRSRT
ncbi:alpha/beta fold hydrolase [Nocardia sp. NRRL S-836]|uniref:alpha/beta fold hydrolase n=1 Tax=Nocardia sp. NRRL S-836 TaxID=1519492 RepID=UPI0006BF1CF2|nr:alpha/beta hydrolase [Nocardia sp. NRRL S-836]KOV81150.1 alpha/beta hydrolase [Nocardia sp. NRRL S-836]